MMPLQGYYSHKKMDMVKRESGEFKKVFCANINDIIGGIILATSRKRWPMATFIEGLRPCVTMIVVPAATQPMSPRYSLNCKLCASVIER